jgi:hypothetical protein
LRAIDGTLTIARTGDFRSALIPTAADTFTSHNGLHRLHLERDAAGAVTAVRLFPWGEGKGLVLARTTAVPAFITLPRAELERVVGAYSAGGMDARVFLDGGQLKAAIAGQPAVGLIATSPGKFLVAEVDATVDFAPAEGVPQAATLHQGNFVAEFKRKP